MAAKFYVTTAIDYPNGAPHIGHSLEKVAADVGARAHRLRGEDVAFCMGNDENSLHIVTAAKQNGVTKSGCSSKWRSNFSVYLLSAKK